MNGADLGSTCQLFFDNLSTMLGTFWYFAMTQPASVPSEL